MYILYAGCVYNINIKKAVVCRRFVLSILKYLYNFLYRIVVVYIEIQRNLKLRNLSKKNQFFLYSVDQCLTIRILAFY